MSNKIGKGKIGLIFTLDYEIHGNGRGDFNSWAYFPTAQMLDVFDTYEAKLTIMAEMGHYWAMKKYENLFSNEIHLFETQLKDAVRRGHDVQLHIHPQWIDAYFEKDRWYLDFSRRSIERLCKNYEEAFYYLKKGQNDLENLLSPIDPNYQCRCFRAGYLQMQPSQNIIEALQNAGFVSDSSVQKGTVAKDNLRILDYSKAYSRYLPWKISPLEICNRDDSGRIVEFPILTERHILRKTAARITRMMTSKRHRGIDKLIPGFLAGYSEAIQPNVKLNLQDKIKIFKAKSWDYVDFCRKDNNYLISAIKKVLAEVNRRKFSDYVPLVFIGHSKDFFFANHLSLFLDSCRQMKGVEFITYSEAVNKHSMINYER